VDRKKLETRNPKLETATEQPLWNPAEPQTEQRQLIPPGSFFLFLPRLSGKTIFSESHSRQRSILASMKFFSTDSRLSTKDLDPLASSHIALVNETRDHQCVANGRPGAGGMQ
jgi:hypothetical protein